MNVPGLDEVIHATPRLRACAFLATVDRAEFGAVRDILGVSDSVTSKHIKVLSDAGYVLITKPMGLGRVRTWLELTPTGRRAYRNHLAALESIVAASAPEVLLSRGDRLETEPGLSPEAL